MYSLFYATFENRWGATPGKLLFRLRVICANRNFPGWLRRGPGAAIFLAVTQIPLGLLLWFTLFHFASPARPILSLLSLYSAYLFLGLTFATARRKNGFAAVHELLTGTRVVLEAGCASRFRQAVPPPVFQVPESAAPIGPYRALETLYGNAASGITLAYDPRLRRQVWIRHLPAGTPLPPAPLRDLARRAGSAAKRLPLRRCCLGSTKPCPASADQFGRPASALEPGSFLAPRPRHGITRGHQGSKPASRP